MTQVDVNDMNTAQPPRYTSPVFDPRGAFARTLRGGEMARLEREQRNGLAEGKKLESRESDVAHANANVVNAAKPPHYETPTFDPRSAFARTLRGGEIASLERQQRRSVA
jgi:hypothetical protein